MEKSTNWEELYKGQMIIYKLGSSIRLLFCTTKASIIRGSEKAELADSTMQIVHFKDKRY